MPRILEVLDVYRMSLSSLYQRLLVAAGAVAFLVVKWFCRPVRRQPPVEPQGQPINAAPEKVALLEADTDEDEDVEPRSALDAAPNRTGYEAPELSQLDGKEQLHDNAAAAPEEVIMEPISSVQRLLCERRVREGAASQPNQDWQGSSKASSSAQNVDPPAREEPTPVRPVDEAYLRSLIDQELGFPKFAVRKPAPGAGEQLPEPYGDDRSLQDLLDHAFGPPRFAVPKPTSLLDSGADTEAYTDPAPVQTTAARELALAFAASGSRAAAVAAPSDAAPNNSTGSLVGVKRSAVEELSRHIAYMESDDAARAESESLTVLTLSVTHGPASGKRMVADPAGEYTIGRLPDSWLQIMDQEVSGRHAAVRWDGASGRWMLRDMGSLNGTALADEPIGREYKVPGDERPLSHGDVVQLGSDTLLRVELSEARTEPAAPEASAAAEAAAAAAAAASAAAKRHHSGAGSDAASESWSGSILRSHQETVAGLPGLPTPGVMVDCPELGARLYVHNRLGVDHKRLCQGCEDVPHWELPFAPYTGAGIVCVFDGHHGSKAANQAKEYLVPVLRSKLLRRDGRQPPPLPPPPPPTPPRRAEGEDGEDMVEAYDGASSEDVLEEEPPERSGSDGGAAVGREGTAEAITCSSRGTGSSSGGGRGGGGIGINRKAGVLEHGGCAAAVGTSEATGNGCGGGGPPVDAALGGEEVPAGELPPPPAGPSLPPLLRARDIESQRSLLRDTFLHTDQFMSMGEGCTATLVMMETDPQQGGWMLQSANVGDSSAVLVNFSRGSWCRLSEDHRIASSSSERERLAAMGHRVRNRLYGLNISRMLGDRFLKEENLGFLAEPHVSLPIQVAPGDHAVLIVASDGLWDVLSEERVARMLLQEAARSSVTSLPRLQPQASAAPPSASLGCQTVADMLLTKALLQRSKDDITVSVLELGPHLRPQQQQQPAAASQA